MSGTDDKQGRYIDDFLIESHENLDRFDRDLVSLEKDPTSEELLAGIFRSVHTIKGTGGLLGFSNLVELTHAGEELLGRLRAGKIPLSTEIASALLSMADAIRQILATIEQTRSDDGEDHSELKRTLETLRDTPADANRRRGGAATDDAPSPATEAPEAPAASPTPEAQAAAHSALETTIRVDVGLLDQLMNLVGELVLVRNQLLQRSASDSNKALPAGHERLDRITTELQEEVMKTRLQRMATIWNKFPRVVRDLAVSCGKKVCLEVKGEHTELDRSIIEAIKDPLIHLLRNAVDHGIEEPDARVDAGKPPQGRLSLCAFHENGQIRIEVEDDGSGIDPDKVRERVLQKGLLSAAELQQVDERELIQSVFLPGFSTSSEITSISGRGVGLDVVKTNIEKVGGTVELESKPGIGTSFRITIPLTLTIIPALIVTCAGNRYAIPQTSLIELVGLDPDNADSAIEWIQGSPFFRLRGSLLPLIHLDRELRIGNEPARRGAAGEMGESIHIVVLRAHDKQYGLVVDEVLDTEEIVVKRPAKLLKDLHAFAGATIMGDGKVALILDVLKIAEAAHLSVDDRRYAATPAPEAQTASRSDKLLLVEGPGGRRMAVPLALVSRLEEFSSAKLERTGSGTFVQHRGEILPLVDLEHALEGTGATRELLAERLQVVVHGRDGRSTGVVVNRILDIVDGTPMLQEGNAGEPILGTAVLQGRITELLDIESLILEHSPASPEPGQRRSAGVSHA